MKYLTICFLLSIQTLTAYSQINLKRKINYNLSASSNNQGLILNFYNSEVQNNNRTSIIRQNKENVIRARSFNYFKSGNDFSNDHGASMIRKGKILTFTGATIYAITWGIILSNASHYKGRSDALPLLIIQGGGFYCMGTGIVVWVIGKKRFRRYNDSQQKSQL